MKVSIKIPKALLSVWKKELTNKQDCYEKTGVNRQTINKAITTGRCTQKTMDRINVYLIREREKSKRKLNKLC